MILSDLTRYLAEHRQATLVDMVHRFGSSPEALRAMLEVLARKGRVRRMDRASCASGCSGCNLAQIETYEWLDATTPPPEPCRPTT
ncbi:MAG: FeoC-like transcriptional regulator [Bdellovibrio bacteriovorus]